MHLDDLAALFGGLEYHAAKAEMCVAENAAQAEQIKVLEWARGRCGTCGTPSKPGDKACLGCADGSNWTPAWAAKGE